MKYLVTLSHDVESPWEESLRHLLWRNVSVIGEVQGREIGCQLLYIVNLLEERKQAHQYR
jgi:hypothetical protein